MSFTKESEKRAKNLLTPQEPLKNVHIFYRNWVKVASGHYSEFQDLWEIVMIRSVSEAICETIGSMMNQHGGKNRHLDPTYFSMEMVLRVNLGPLHQMGLLVNEILDELKKNGTSFIRANHVSSKDLKVSAAVNTFHKVKEEKSRFPAEFWLENEQKKQQ